LSAPRVSVLIPAFNAERYLGEAIESALGQTRAPFELIVLDDGSSDRTAEVARTFGDGIRYERQENEGIGGARNRCMELARGEYLAFLDADDRWERDKLALQLEAMCSSIRPDIVFGRVRHFVSPELPAEERARIACPPEAAPGYLPSAMLASRDVFERVGRFATDLHVGEFIDWMARARGRGLRELMLDETVLRRRLHDANQGVRHRDRRGDFAHVLKASLDRRRAGGAR
jgi:glycosyltransferase involved in cell wall biosynthesis